VRASDNKRSPDERSDIRGLVVPIPAYRCAYAGYPLYMRVTVTDQNPPSTSPFQSIRAVDYTVIFVRDMAAMRRFYEEILCLSLTRELSAGWIEYQIGGNTLALSRPGRTAKDAPTPTGSASLQLAFKVAVDDVDRCADELVRHGVVLLEPPTNQPFGHRTLFFRDPD
jgi:catechol 2,3-dioxygenase-like lactoylglutathione lyase family enzyme